MPRRARFCPAGYPVHLIQRGNNRQAIFTCDADLAAYAHWLAEGAERFGVVDNPTGEEQYIFITAPRTAAASTPSSEPAAAVAWKLNSGPRNTAAEIAELNCFGPPTA